MQDRGGEFAAFHCMNAFPSWYSSPVTMDRGSLWFGRPIEPADALARMRAEPTQASRRLRQPLDQAKVGAPPDLCCTMQWHTNESY